MPNTIVVDSSVFISSLGINDEYSTKSRKFFEKCKGYEIYVSALVVAEVLTVLSKQGMKNAANLLRYFSSLNLVPLDYDFLKYFADHLPSPTTLKTSDLIVAVSAMINQSTLITWDKKLLSLNKKFLSVITPTECLK